MFDLVVTRHQGLVQWLLDNYIVTHDVPVLSHVDDVDRIVGLNVVGVLPLHMIVHCRSFASVDLDIPASLRGQDLNADQVASLNPRFVFYNVHRSHPLTPLDLVTQHADRVTDLHIYNFGAYPTSGSDATADLSHRLIDQWAYDLDVH